MFPRAVAVLALKAWWFDRDRAVAARLESEAART